MRVRANCAPEGAYRGLGGLARVQEQSSPGQLASWGVSPRGLAVVIVDRVEHHRTAGWHVDCVNVPLESNYGEEMVMAQRNTSVQQLSELAEQTERLAQHVEEMRQRIAARRRHRDLTHESAPSESSSITVPGVYAPGRCLTPEPRPALRPSDSNPFLPRLPAPVLPANDRSSTTGVRPVARDAGRYSIIANQDEHGVSEERLYVPSGSPRAKTSH